MKAEEKHDDFWSDTRCRRSTLSSIKQNGTFQVETTRLTHTLDSVIQKEHHTDRQCPWKREEETHSHTAPTVSALAMKCVQLGKLPKLKLSSARILFSLTSFHSVAVNQQTAGRMAAKWGYKKEKHCHWARKRGGKRCVCGWMLAVHASAKIFRYVGVVELIRIKSIDLKRGFFSMCVTLSGTNHLDHSLLCIVSSRNESQAPGQLWVIRSRLSFLPLTWRESPTRSTGMSNWVIRRCLHLLHMYLLLRLYLFYFESSNIILYKKKEKHYHFP